MSDAVRQIKEKLNIIDVISPYVELQKAGKNFKGKSPFSAEKTPSFYVSPDRGMYYCFSTSQGGDIFNFIQVMEGVEFKEALKVLAEKAGVELVREDPRKRTERERQYAALEAATAFFSESLEKEPGAKSYLDKRGVAQDTIAKWRIGYSPGPPNHGWRELKDNLESAGYTQDELLKTGLIKMANSGKDPFDVFRDRIVFPMSESNGKVVAFSGRILAQDSEAPKYVNSPETELYKKSELLYGYDKAKTGIRNLNFSLIVEGQFDVVMCHQAGYENTVAVSGTALTVQHVQLLERLSDKVVLALDADRAGINAMKKGAELMLGRGLDVKVAEIPLGKDPADLIQSNPADFKQVIGKSVHIIEFLLHVLRREIEDDRSFKLKASEEILPYILLLPSRIDQEHFVAKVSESIGTTVDAVRFELDRIREVNSAKAIKAESYHKPEEKVKSSESLAPAVEAIARVNLFLAAAVQVIPSKLAVKVKSEMKIILSDYELAEIPVSDLAGVMFSLEQQFAGYPDLVVKEELLSKLNQLKFGLIKQKTSGLRRELIEAEGSQDTASFNKVLKLIQECESQLKEDRYSIEVFFPEKD